MLLKRRLLLRFLLLRERFRDDAMVVCYYMTKKISKDIIDTVSAITLSFSRMYHCQAVKESDQINFSKR